jgi:hypothetical protein
MRPNLFFEPNILRVSNATSSLETPALLAATDSQSAGNVLLPNRSFGIARV